MRAGGSNWVLRSITDMAAPATPGRVVILARHGRTEWNRLGRYQGRSNPPLSDAGHVDAVALAFALRAERLAAIVSSPLRRAFATAQRVAEMCGDGRVQVDRRLVEISFGTWEGRTQAEIRAETPEALRRWKRNPETMQFPAGETLTRARARLRSFLADLAETPLPGEGAVLVVTHAGLIRLACLDAAGLGLEHFRTVAVEPGAVRRFVLTRNSGTAGDASAAVLSEAME